MSLLNDDTAKRVPQFPLTGIEPGQRHTLGHEKAQPVKELGQPDWRDGGPKRMHGRRGEMPPTRAASAEQRDIGCVSLCHGGHFVLRTSAPTSPPADPRSAGECQVWQGATSEQRGAQRCEVLELDVTPPADGVPVLLHDPSLDRTTNQSGQVRARTSTELSAVDAGYRFTPDGGASFPWRGRGCGIPTLREVLERYPHTDRKSTRL